jgi:hypothetical protein
LTTAITPRSAIADTRERARVVCHVAAIDSRNNRVAASLTPDGWLLPTAIVPTRIPRRDMLTQICAAMPMPVIPRCLAFPRASRDAESSDYLLVADLCGNARLASEMVDCDHLSTHAALVPYQKLAWTQFVTAGHRRSLGLQPFWIRRAAEWVEASSSWPKGTNTGLTQVNLYRASEHRTVAAFTIGQETLHFKANVAEPFTEAHVTQIAARAFPSGIAATRAFDAERGWWLTEHLNGTPLTADLWPKHLTAVDVWIALQLALRHEHERLLSVGVLRLDRQHLEQVAVETLSSAQDHHRDGHFVARIAARVRKLLAHPCCDYVHEGLLHFDAAGRNILQTERGLAFIDLETACVGPSVICGELLARKMKHELTVAQRAELSAHAVTEATRASDGGHTPTHEEVAALTDLCLLAFHHAVFTGDGHGAIDAESPRYAWSRVAADFLDRANTWII